MEQNLEQIQQLLALFDRREELNVEANKNIALALNDTVLIALYELFGLPHECLVWEDMQVVDAVLVLRVGVEYNPTGPMTNFLSRISVSTGFGNGPPVKVNRTLQLGIPLTVVFQPKGQIINWFLEMAAHKFPQSDVVPPAPKPLDPLPECATQATSFDPTSLSQEQVSQLIYFQGLTKGTKQ